MVIVSRSPRESAPVFLLCTFRSRPPESLRTLLPGAALSFRVLRCPSECFAVIPSASLSFRVLRCPSECFAVFPSASLSFRASARNLVLARYAPAPLNIRSQRHPRGAYLHKNVEICAADPRYMLSTASSLCISPEMCTGENRCIEQ